MNKIENDEENMKNEIFKEYFGYHNPSFLAKYKYKYNQSKNEQIVNQVNDALIHLRNAVNKNPIPENENPDEVIDIVEKNFNFNKQQRGKGPKILTRKQMFQRLPIVPAQVKAGNTSENLLNKSVK